ncbi:hypothetical protein [Pseudomonas coronafaciens]|uniref:hypothetical protein n=1 Tax=Pseudomonas coronafaciens TaxID=53409 RepID=UPI0013C2C39F|nr:hypothetical protein [Pseudomonas coronafaciens]
MTKFLACEIFSVASTGGLRPPGALRRISVVAPLLSDLKSMTVASLRSLTGRAKSLAGRSTRPAIYPDLTVRSTHLSDDFEKLKIKS